VEFVDSRDDGVPVFIVEPAEFYYIVKNRPLSITCVARPAVQINFKCSGQWVSPQSHVTVELADPDTGGSRIQTSIEVDKDEVDKVTGASASGAAAASGVVVGGAGGGGGQGHDAYWCECHAWNSRPEHSQPVNAKSRRAYIHSACEYYLDLAAESKTLYVYCRASLAPIGACMVPMISQIQDYAFQAC
jgi:hypothetical protein